MATPSDTVTQPVTRVPRLPLLGRFELLRFKGRLPRLALVFVLLVPLLYGAIYLAANWDPYGRLDRLPVAVVNADTGTTYGRTAIHAGDDFVENLHTQHNFDYVDVDAAEADRGLREGDYYLAITVPADFSRDLVSGQGDDPQRAGIMLRRNDANGFVIGSITNSAQNAIARSVDESASASYFDAVFANLAKIRSGLQDATDGADKLHDGIVSADDGSAKVADGARTAASGADDLHAGATQLATGLGTAQKGSGDLVTGIDRLHTGAGRLADGSAQVADGTQQLNDRVQPVLKTAARDLPKVERETKATANALDDLAQTAAGRTGSISSDLAAVDTALDSLQEDNPELADDPAFQRARQRVADASGRSDEIAGQVKDGAARVHRANQVVQSAGDLAADARKASRDLDRLNDGAQSVASGAKTLNSGLGDAESGARRLDSGIGTAATGAVQLRDGAGSLASGLADLSGGASDLHSGLGKLDSGSKTLATQLQKGTDRIPTPTADEQDRAVQVLSSPADVTMTVDNAAGVYGRGLAPLFFSIALWVFGISAFLVVRPISGRALAGRASAVRLGLAGWAPVGAVAVVAGWLMLGVVWATLGLDPLHPGLAIGVVTLGAVAFSAVAHLLRTALGTVGASLLLVTLILQLAAAGGTYPSPILPGFFKAIHPFLPMTYLIDAFRVVVSGGLAAHLLRDVGILAALAAGALTLTVLTVARRQQFAVKDLHPPLVAP
ncbi:putative membrane protein [Microlunatus sagamiharensis]|uniref:Putative membrane protein n=1 Tax=Microlunatus sagamiharensis TaxID=546874 RepID=A0A1H2N208_9ACTN|nr:YhgE/Pip domain-containing protein [Microlunatus sagamiharensis]SDU99547.1 putative membrane protein [Microlunatus sagamiharensis]